MADPTGGPPDDVLVGPVLSRDGGERLLDVVRVMQRLRGPGGCPWDAEQTHQTLGRHLLEETHETLEAIDANDMERLKDELGDVLLQVIFHAEMARLEGVWDVDDVADALVRKLIRRHPHVFGDTDVDSADEVLVNWEKIKSAEKDEEHGIDEEIPPTLPALSRAAKVQRRAAGSGVDWRSAEAALAQVHERLGALDESAAAGSADAEDDLGDLLFAVASVGRRLNVDPETALRKATARFGERFARIREAAEHDGVDLEQLSDEELLSRYRAAR
jgi:tetrapyrrole methylase family protein / MazG family protein